MPLRVGLLAAFAIATSACGSDTRYHLMLSDECAAPGRVYGADCAAAVLRFEVQETTSCGWHLCAEATAFASHEITVVPGSECALERVECSGAPESSDRCTAVFSLGEGARCGALVELTTRHGHYLSECWIGQLGLPYSEAIPRLRQECDALRGGGSER